MTQALDVGYIISEQTLKSFERLEKMSPDLRECVYEYGEAIVVACLCAGVKDPKNIRQLVREIWEGARQPLQRRKKMGSLDWILMQAGANISAKTLVRILRDNHHYIVPEQPTTQMINASMNTVSNFDQKVTKKDKHALRLRAAIAAGVKHLWPDL